MKKSLQIIFLLSFILTGTLFPQLKYKMTQSSSTYAPLSTYSTFTWVNSVVGTAVSAPTAIGFPFNYNGVMFDSLQVSADGFIRLGSGITTTTATNALKGTLRGIIAPLWDDLAIADSLNQVVYTSEGTAPNRVFKVEYKAMKWLAANLTANAVFMVELWENGSIVFNYGAFGTVATTNSASVGLNDASPLTGANLGTGLHISVNFTGNTGSVVTQQTMGGEFNGVSVAPDPGTVLTFTPHVSVPMSGIYTVGGASPSFASPSEAAMALNLNGVSGAVTLNIRPGTYDDVFHLINVKGTSAANTITVKNESGDVILSPAHGSQTTTAPSATLGDAIVRFDGTQYTTIEGLKLIANETMATAIKKYEVGILMANAVVSLPSGASFWGARFNTVKNVSIDMNAFTGLATGIAGAMGIRLGTVGLTTDSSAANSYNTFQNITVEDFWRAGIFMYGFYGQMNPDRGNKITGVDGRSTFKNVNIAAGAASDVRCIEANAQRDLTIENTDINDIVSNISMATNGVYGIRLNPASGTDFMSGTLTIRNVNIWNIENQNAGVTTGQAVGIENNLMEGGSTVTVENCKIYDIYSNGSTTTRAVGMLLNSAGASGSIPVKINVYNNLIYDLRAPRTTSLPGVRGIDIQAGAGIAIADVAYNTVYIDSVGAAAGAASLTSAAITWANFATSAITLRNNIFVNVSSQGTALTGRAAAVYATSAANLARITGQSNGNFYYAGTPGALRPLVYDGANSYDSLYKYWTAIGAKDQNSVTGIAPFTSSVPPYDLTVSTSVATPIEGGGFPVPGVTKDITGATRNSTTPDMGAYEFSGISQDVSAPAMVYDALLNTGAGATSRTITAMISDRSGLATGTGKPRLYYKKPSDVTWAFDDAPVVSGSSFTFTINYANVGGGSAGANDTIQYFFAAQDVPGNSATSPWGGTGVNPPGQTAPTNPASYIVTANALAGDYTVGLADFNRASGKNLTTRFVRRTVLKEVEIATDAVSTEKTEKELQFLSPSALPGTTIMQEVVEDVPVLFENGQEYTGPLSIEGIYATLPAAVSDLNSRGVSGPTRFLLTDSRYDLAAQLAISVTSANKPTATNRVTFKPAAGMNDTISVNSATSVGILIATSFVTFDGSNTDGGTTRNMVIQNIGTGTSSGAVFVLSAEGVIIKNLRTRCATGALAYGIIFSDSRNGLVENCNPARTAIGIQGQSNSLNLKVYKNEVGFGFDPTTSLADSINSYGIGLVSSPNYEVIGNVVSGIIKSLSTTPDGIIVGSVTSGIGSNNGLIANNYVTNIKSYGVGAAGWGARGIRLSNASGSSNIALVNNMITNIGYGTDASASFAVHGIYISQGGGYNIAYNTIHLANFIESAALVTASNAIGMNSANISNVNIVNNVLSNSQNLSSVNGTTYAVSSTTAIHPTVMFDNNNYWTPQPSGRMIGLAGVNYTTLNAWSGFMMDDYFSISADPSLTDSIDATPVLNSPAAWNNNGAGYPIPGLDTDILGNPRSASVANGPTDIGAFEYTPANGVNPAPATPDVAPALNGTQVFWANGRPVAEIMWGAAGTVPTSVELTNFSGMSPDANAPGLVTGKSFWRATATGGSGYTYRIKFYYNPNSLGMLDEGLMKLGKKNGSIWYPVDSTFINMAMKTVSSSSLNSFSDFCLYTGTIPVEMTSFVSSVADQKIILSWTTATETNNRGFEVERKMNGEWISAGFVAGKGTTQQISTYSFTDDFSARPFTGTVSYRLKQIDLDGTFSYSSIISNEVDFMPKEYALYQNYPNPFNPSTNVKFALPFESKVTISVFNVTGERVEVLFSGNLTPGYHELAFNGAGKATGIYFYNIEAQALNGSKSFRAVKKMVLIK